MAGDTLLVFGLLAATVLLFVSDWLRLDVVALLSLLALTGVVRRTRHSQASPTPP